jgi:hypothetical protein
MNWFLAELYFLQEDVIHASVVVSVSLWSLDMNVGHM